MSTPTLPPNGTKNGNGSKLNFFGRLAHDVSETVGTPVTFSVALLVVAAWAVSGPIFGFSNTWQLIINTGTTIVTFLLVILLQHMQNHDSKAMHMKLNEIIRAVRGARNALVDLEEMSDEDLELLHAEFERVRSRAIQKRNSNGNGNGRS